VTLEGKVLFTDVCDQKQALHAFIFLPDGCIFLIFESFSNENEYNVSNAHSIHGNRD